MVIWVCSLNANFPFDFAPVIMRSEKKIKSTRHLIFWHFTQKLNYIICHYIFQKLAIPNICELQLNWCIYQLELCKCSAKQFCQALATYVERSEILSNSASCPYFIILSMRSSYFWEKYLSSIFDERMTLKLTLWHFTSYIYDHSYTRLCNISCLSVIEL